MTLTEARSPQDLDSIWNFSKPGETEARFRALVPEAKGSQDQEFYLQLLTQIARAQGLQRRFEEAHQTLDRVQPALSSKTPVAEVRYALERGRVMNSSKRPQEALPLFAKAFDLASARGFDSLAVDAAHMVAIAEPDSDKQMQWNLRAASIAEKSKDQKARDWLGSLYNNMGWTYHDSGRPSEALEVFKKALAFRESKGEPTSIRVAKWSIARTYRSMKRYEEALKIQTSLEGELERVGETDGYVFEELGELYLVTSKAELAKKYFALAYRELSKDEWVKANDAPRLKRVKELGGVK